MQKLNIGVVGSRGFDNYAELKSYLDSFVFIHEDKDICIVSGGARGADSLAEQYATENGLRFQCFPADWGKFGKIAGFLRNDDLVKNCDRIIAFWDGKSSGTKDTIAKAERAEKPSYVILSEVQKTD